jgi:hypothetical protein
MNLSNHIAMRVVQTTFTSDTKVVAKTTTYSHGFGPNAFSKLGYVGHRLHFL